METGRRLNNDVRSSHVSYQRSAESAAAAAHNDVTCCTSATDADDELLAENRRLKELNVCRVCMEQHIDTVFLPCGHLVCCATCSHALRNCPICRSLIRATVKAFFS